MKNPMDRDACRATVHRISESWTWLDQLGAPADIKGRDEDGFYHGGVLEVVRGASVLDLFLKQSKNTLVDSVVQK